MQPYVRYWRRQSACAGGPRRCRLTKRAGAIGVVGRWFDIDRSHRRDLDRCTLPSGQAQN